MEEKSKILKIIIGALLFIIVIGASYWVYDTFIKNNSGGIVKNEIYTCPMHPQIIQDRPGLCPICGMDLVKKNELDTEDMQDHDLGDADLNAVKLSPSQQVLANVQTQKVKLMQFQGEKTFNGYVKINEKKLAKISTAVSGKIVNMFVNFEGQTVRKGQPVLEIYSPELVSTQKEYLLALDNFNQVKTSGNRVAIDQAQSLVNSARERLTLWEMTPKQIEELERTRELKTTSVQYSRYSGIITKKLLQVGHWAMMGENIFEVADLSTVWVIANVYESDMQYIKNGQTVDIYSSAYPDEPLRAKINFINPVFDPDSRTLEVRIDVSNPSLVLKPDMYVKVKINTYASQSLGVRKNAVIRTGEHDIVYIEKEKGVYVPKQVTVSYEQDEYYAISSGLEEGDVVVVSGGFLIDSESQIQKGFTSGHEKHTGNNDNDLKINPDQDIMKDMEKKKEEEHKH
ncbi:MAG: efflux RND transporter periplasmic adaptor subunit [Chlorobi bacterium]|nr:efflux RND transporter periplasmic adaptor subunit [Chlorobiota bacterium]MCI0715501.1 efflux RND transporter periplasmic adaptor subunit [Chlorobiota bacterium]